MFRYLELTLPAPLSPHIRAVWHLESDAEPASAEPIVPDGCVEIVLSFADPMIEHPIGGVPDHQDPQFVVGQLARPTIVAPTGRVDIWGVRLQPWAAGAFLGIPGLELRNRTVSLPFVATKLAQELTDVGNRPHASRGDAICQVLRQRIDRLPTIESHVVALTRRVLAADQEPTLRALASWSGYGTRRIQRIFDDAVGYGPKLLMRIGRFQRALRLSRAARPPLSWAAIAARTGYYDQAHLIRDSQQFAGCSPTALFPATDSVTEIFVAR